MICVVLFCCCWVLGLVYMDDWYIFSLMLMDWVMMDGRGGVYSMVGSGLVGCWFGVVKLMMMFWVVGIEVLSIGG